MNKLITSKILISSPILCAISSTVFFYVLSFEFFYQTPFFDKIKSSWVAIFSLQDNEYSRNLGVIDDYILFHTLCLFFVSIFIIRSFFYEWPFLRAKYKTKETISLLKTVCFGQNKESSVWGLIKNICLIYFGLLIMVSGSGAIFYGGSGDQFYHLFEAYGGIYYLIVSAYISVVFILAVPFIFFISIVIVNEFYIKERSIKKGDVR